MTAMLAAIPIRIRNFAALELGRHLRRAGACWSLHLSAEETKARRPDVWPISEEIGGRLERYIEAVRPALLARRVPAVQTDRLWIGVSGRPIGDQVIRPIIADLTRCGLGVQINPHRFRHCAVTTFGLELPEDAMKTSALLGHASFEITQRHYVVQQRHLVQRSYLDRLDERVRQAARGRGCLTPTIVSERPISAENGAAAFKSTGREPVSHEVQPERTGPLEPAPPRCHQRGWREPSGSRCCVGQSARAARPSLAKRRWTVEAWDVAAVEGLQAWPVTRA